jgi:hypothetical protein
VRNRRRFLIILAVAVVLVAATAGVVALRLQPPLSRSGEDPFIRQTAEQFLRGAAKSDLAEACLFVIPSGGYLGRCREDLEKRADLTKLRELGESITVRAFHVDGDTATITSADLEPRPSWDLTVTVVNDPDDGWKVRKLNGQPITFED